jgi:hypothetical protein
MTRQLLASCVVVVLASVAAAQEMRIFYPVPPASAVAVSKDQAYGEALLGASQFAAACTELEKLKGKGLGPRDLGVPAARACMQNGDAEAAIAWLKSIPQRYLPRALEKDPIFVPIQNRPDFKALFQTGG